MKKSVLLKLLPFYKIGPQADSFIYKNSIVYTRDNRNGVSIKLNSQKNIEPVKYRIDEDETQMRLL